MAPEGPVAFVQVHGATKQTTWRRWLGLCLAALFALSSFAGLLEDANTRHEFCEEHGRLVHVSDLHDAPHHDDEPHEGEHEHCGFWADRQLALAPEVGSPLGRELPGHAELVHAEGATQCPASIGARYLFAPKTSPPLSA